MGAAPSSPGRMKKSRGMVGGDDERIVEGESASGDSTDGDPTGGAGMPEPSPGVTVAWGESMGGRGDVEVVDGGGIMPFSARFWGH